MTKYTKLPWKIDDTYRTLIQRDHHGRLVASTDCGIKGADKYTTDIEDENIANAAFIVKACNSYWDLLSLIDGVKDVVEIFKIESPAQEQWKFDWLQKARELIAAADGKL